MKRAQRRLQDLNYTFDFRHRPVMEVEPGEPFALETEMHLLEVIAYRTTPLGFWMHGI
jgi:hypothetical protein